MRVFWVFLEGRTDGNFKLNSLPNAGRMDIAARVVNAAFWLSGGLRNDVTLYLTFTGPPCPPKTIKLIGSEMRGMYPDERNICAVLRKGLKVDSKEWFRFHPGGYVSRHVEEVKQELENEPVVLEENGEEFIPGKYTYIVGGRNDVPETYLKKIGVKRSFSLGKRSYLSSHVIAVVNYLLDREEEKDEPMR